MKDILLLYDGEDAESWVGYMNNMLCKNELALNVDCKNLRTDQDEVLRECENFLVVSILVSPSMLETLSSASDRLAPVLQKHACVSVILLYTDLSELRDQIQTYRTMDKWIHFDITDKSDSENKKTVSEIIDLLEKERESHKTLLEAAAAKKERKSSTEATAVTKLTQKDSVAKPKPTGVEEKSKQTKRGTRHARSILETVCPKKISKSREEVVMVLKQSLEGVVQVEFKKTETKIDTKKINPYCYSFIAPDLEFGRQQFYLYVDGNRKSLSSLHYIAPTQMAYECPAFLCQALDIPPEDMASLDRRLTGIFRASLPYDEGLSRILSPATLAAEAAASKVDHHFPTLLHFAAFHGLRDLCNALLDMPGAIAAFHKTNIDDKDPLDLAEDAQHEDLADFFRDYLEMQETVTTYQQLYIHMYDKQGKTPAAGQPGYLEMIGYGPDHVEAVDYDDEDEYEIKKSTLESGVAEVLPDEDIIEEPKPGLPPRKPKPPATLSKPSSKISIESAPPVTPRKPRIDPVMLPQESPEAFMGMIGEPSPLRTGVTGSGTLDELVEIQEAFKRNEINERDVDMLYTSWTERHKEGKASASMKERQKQLSEMKEKYQVLIKTAEKKEKRGFFERLTMKKKPTKPAIAIQHLPSQNPYTSWSQVPSGFAPFASEREARMSTISNSSTSSSSSYASSTSRDSAMSIQSLQNIPESDSDLDELGQAPPVPTRRRSTERPKDDHRKSLGEQFLLSVQNKPNSRLPQPPPQHYKSRTLPVKAPAQKVASLPYSKAPVVPPRKTSN